MVGAKTMPKTRSRSRTGCLTCRRRKKKCDEESYPVCLNCKRKSLTCEWPQTKHELNKMLKQVRYIQNKPTKSAGPSSHGAAGWAPSSGPPVAEICKESGPQTSDVKSIQDYSHVPEDISLSYLESQGDPKPQTIPFKVTELNPSTDGEHTIESSSSIRHNLDQERTRLDVSSISIPRRQNGYFLERIALQQDCVDSDEENQLEKPSASLPNKSFTSIDPNMPYYLETKIPSFESDSRNSLQNSYSPNAVGKPNSINFEDFIN